MKHNDHVRLLQPGIPGPGGVWADLGAGRGAFTLALAEALGEGGVIYAVDKKGRALDQLRREMERRFPQAELHTLAGDFTRPLDLPPLDGVIMANALHFVKRNRQVRVVQQIRSYLKAGGMAGRGV